MNKVIFLDFDGVVNNFTELAIGEKNLFSKSNIKPIEDLFLYCKNNNIGIVISSAWNIAGMDNCKECLYEFIENDLIDMVVIGVTRYSFDLPNPVRNNEILEWLSNNPHIKEWIAIDDTFDYYEKYKNKVLIIDGTKGFLNLDLDKLKQKW